jgi:hypothetical protein
MAVLCAAGPASAVPGPAPAVAAPLSAGPLGAPGPLATASHMLSEASGPQLSVVLATLERPCARGARAEGRTASDLGLEQSWAARSASLTRLLPGGGAWDANLAKSCVFLGVEAVALLSYLRVRGGSEDAAEAAGPPAASRIATAAEPGVVEPLRGEFDLALAPRALAAGSWRGAAPQAAGIYAAATPSPAGAGRLDFFTSTADRVAGLVGAFRALRLNSYEVAQDTRLRIDARTGRHARCFLVLTRKF